MFPLSSVHFPAGIHLPGGVHQDLLPPDIRPLFCIRSVSFEPSRILSHHASFIAPIHTVPTLLDEVCSENTRILHSCFLCPHCCPPRYLILYYYLSCFSCIPDSTSVDQLSQSPPSVSFLCSWNSPCVLPGLTLLHGCYGPENQPSSLTLLVQMAVHSLCSVFACHDLQPEEQKTTSSLPYISVSPSGLLTRWGF